MFARMSVIASHSSRWARRLGGWTSLRMVSVLLRSTSSAKSCISRQPGLFSCTYKFRICHDLMCNPGSTPTRCLQPPRACCLNPHFFARKSPTEPSEYTCRHVQVPRLEQHWLCVRDTLVVGPTRRVFQCHCAWSQREQMVHQLPRSIQMRVGALRSNRTDLHRQTPPSPINSTSCSSDANLFARSHIWIPTVSSDSALDSTDTREGHWARTWHKFTLVRPFP